MTLSAALPHNPPSVAARFALIIGGLRAAVASRIGYYAVTGPMILYICNRLNRMNERFQTLAALVFAGKLPPERVYRPRAPADTVVEPPPPDPEAAGEKEFFPIWRLVPTYRFAWLCMVAPNWAGPQYAAVWGAAMRDLLADPRMAALLAATPRVAKLLRPLCWGLGIEASMLRPRPAPTPPADDAVASDADCSPGRVVCSGFAAAAAWAGASGAQAVATRAETHRGSGFFARA
jgi:hypothetical protein